MRTHDIIHAFRPASPIPNLTPPISGSHLPFSAHRTWVAQRECLIRPVLHDPFLPPAVEPQPYIFITLSLSLHPPSYSSRLRQNPSFVRYFIEDVFLIAVRSAAFIAQSFISVPRVQVLFSHRWPVNLSFFFILFRLSSFCFILRALLAQCLSCRTLSSSS